MLEERLEKNSEVKIRRVGMVITGTGDEPIKDVVVVVEGDKIKEAESESCMKRLVGAIEIDLKNTTLMLGMIDVVHAFATL